MTRPRLDAVSLPAIGRWLGQFAMFSVLWLVLFAIVPMAWGWQSRAIISGSMTPKIKVGDVVVVDPGVPRNLKAGQVITFTDPSDIGRVLTHRLVKHNDDGTWQTKGDANRTPDSTPITKDHIVGKPKILVPWVGMFAYWMATGKTVYALGVGGLLVVLCTLGASALRTPATDPAAAPASVPTRRGRHRTRFPLRQRLGHLIRRVGYLVRR